MAPVSNFTTNIASKTCAAGNSVMAQTNRVADERGGLFLSMIIHFPTVPLIVSLYITHRAIDRQGYRVVKCQWGVKVWAGGSILGPTTIKEATESELSLPGVYKLVTYAFTGLPVQVQIVIAAWLFPLREKTNLLLLQSCNKDRFV